MCSLVNGDQRCVQTCCLHLLTWTLEQQQFLKRRYMFTKPAGLHPNKTGHLIHTTAEAAARSAAVGLGRTVRVRKLSHMRKPICFWGPSSLLLKGDRVLIPRVKTRSEVNHSALSNVKVKNEWSLSSSPRISLYDVDRESFTSTFTRSGTQIPHQISLPPTPLLTSSSGFMKGNIFNAGYEIHPVKEYVVLTYRSVALWCWY